MALGKREVPEATHDTHTANFLLPGGQNSPQKTVPRKEEAPLSPGAHLFHAGTKAIIWGMQTRAVQVSKCSLKIKEKINE